jgi:hypothetical protein
MLTLFSLLLIFRYGHVSRFRDGGNHFDLPDDLEEDDQSWCYWVGACCWRWLKISVVVGGVGVMVVGLVFSDHGLFGGSL